MSDRIKLAVLGGSALATPLLIESLAAAHPAHAYLVALIGRDEERLRLVAAVAADMLSRHPEADFSIETHLQPETGLEGANFVLNQVRVGGLQGRAFDETFPRQFGIPGEETVGPGGFSNALRGIPVVLGFCRLIEQHAPDALLLNLTNPSSMIQYAIRRFTSVNVIGTCDSPVSLMEMVAAALQAPVGQLQFEMGGMHHFGWISGVRYQGQDRMPEIMQKLEALPKIGSDPEIVRAIGALPSTYLKYYFHPDRQLAATEGRTIRAHQLMALADQMLEDFRRWQPGAPPETLTRRGAVWYDKIVAPTLLALAEATSTELVLSSDNGQTLPFLPPQAIIEAPFALAGGKLGMARSASLPQDVQGMLAGNCAYEMLAAQAIAEKDYSLALRALTANLLVSNFNQARGILDLIWPQQEKAQIRVEIPKPAVAGEALKIPGLHYGDDLLERYDPPENDYAIITMEEPWELAVPRLGRPAAAVAFMRQLDWYRLEALERALPPVSAILAIGGGTPTDAAKYVAWKRHLPVDIFPSITSVDASVTKSIAARAGGHVTYIGHIVPRQVYVDFRLIRAAPARLNRSGVGDLICGHTALWDWKLAHQHTGEAYDPASVDTMQQWLDRIPAKAEAIRQVTDEGIRFIMEAFADVSIICRRFGSSRPQEASDHTFAYNAEYQTGKAFLHGELVALGTYVMACLQDNQAGRLPELYRSIGLLWQPSDIGLTRPEFEQTLRSLNWYQQNFGRRYSVLNERQVDEAFIQSILARLTFV
jgi:6-phospho-beta-glucosidase